MKETLGKLLRVIAEALDPPSLPVKEPAIPAVPLTPQKPEVQSSEDLINRGQYL